MYGSQILSMFIVALFNLTNTAFLICLSLKSFRVFLTLGWTPLILELKKIEGIKIQFKNYSFFIPVVVVAYPLVLMTKANLG